MNRTIPYILSAIAATAGPMALAQDLSTEVVVDRTVVPEEKEAVRPSSLTPALSLPAVEMPQLLPARFNSLSAITRTYSRLDPAAGALAAAKSPWRGYAALGYFPLLHGGAAAGYRILDTDKITLDASLQADGSRNKPLKRDPRHFTYIDARAGVDGAWAPMASSRLGFGASYEFLDQQTPIWEMQTVGHVTARADWTSSVAAISYSARAEGSFDMPGNTIIHRQAFNPSRDIIFYQPYQQQYLVDLAGSYSFAGASAVSLALGANLVHSGNCVYNVFQLARGGMAGYVQAVPSYSLTKHNIRLSAGARLSYGVGAFSQETFRVAPDISVQWSPTASFAAWIKAGGGENVMTNHDMRQYTPYQIFIYEAANAWVPVKVTAGVNFSPLRGLSIAVGGGYAKAERWQMFSTTIPTFLPFDISGWNVNAAASYSWKFLKLSANAMYAPGSRTSAWLDNRDRARLVVGANAEINPIDPFTIGVGFDGRLDRNCYTYGDKRYSLGDIANLNAYASWRFSDRLTVFARCQNILGHVYLVAAQVQSEKQTGAIGLEVKF